MKLFQTGLIFFLLSFSLSAFASQGEKAPFEIKGDTVKVNNSICASSGSPMDKSTLGDFTNNVTYEGNDPKFAKYKGKTLVFNQCCGGCIAKFPGQWKENPEKIMAFHGLK
jgi:hypothetical protein